MTLRPASRRTVVLAGLSLAVTTLTGCGSRSGPGVTTATTDASTATSDGGTMTGDRPADLGGGAMLTPGDHGATVRLRPGEEAALRLPPPWDSTSPEVSAPDVVEVVPVDHFADPGYAEFGLLALAAGDVTVRVDGPDRVLQLYVVVEP